MRLKRGSQWYYAKISQFAWWKRANLLLLLSISPRGRTFARRRNHFLGSAIIPIKIQATSSSRIIPINWLQAKFYIFSATVLFAGTFNKRHMDISMWESCRLTETVTFSSNFIAAERRDIYCHVGQFSSLRPAARRRPFHLHGRHSLPEPWQRLGSNRRRRMSANLNSRSDKSGLMR